MRNRVAHSSPRPLFVLALGLALLVGVNAAGEEPYATGDKIAPFTLEDQHGATHAVDASAKLILFSRDMDGGDLLKQALADAASDTLTRQSAYYVADISGMPGLVARMFALPAMRKRPYVMLLDREGETTARLPDVEGQATLIFLDALTIQRIVHLGEAAAVRQEIDAAAGSD